jgi:hypothetical protein
MLLMLEVMLLFHAFSQVWDRHVLLNANHFDQFDLNHHHYRNELNHPQFHQCANKVKAVFSEIEGSRE